ncbi:MAG: peptidase M11 [bacterium]|uniref:Peptidase M11 n=1 Tax=Candidatus Methylomirabilis tolerans TaxID=3123416 RepID=A0AAJ1AIM1_9BACT|nr:peptidase M11 [Candidatus Methylomirabilis sp.]
MAVRRLTNDGGSRAVRRGRRIITLLLLGLVLAVSAGTSVALSPSSSQPNPSAESLTHTLVALNVRYQLAGPAGQAQLLDNFLSVAAARQQLLTTLIANDPTEVLRVAVPANLRAGMPPAVQAYVEEAVEVEGALEVLHEDRYQGSRYLYFLEALGERFTLHFAADAPTHLETGSQVRVTGVRVERAIALQSWGSSVQTIAAALPNTFGGQKTLVMLVNFQDKATQPYTPASAQGVMTTTSNFDLEGSFQQTWLTPVVDSGQVADVRGWYTISLLSTVCDYNTLASQAKSAATAARVNLSAYSRYVYAFPNNTGCGWWGLGSVGGNPSQAWINGSFALKVVGHEMGHNLGLWHSRAWECGTTTLGPSCSIIEYGNTVDIMGNPSSGHFNAFQKERLGWLNYGSSPPITTVSGDGTYWIDPSETLGINPKALKILKSTDLSTGKKTWYYVESRQAIGFDSFLSNNSNVLNGVVISMGSESSGNSSDLLDMTPATSSWSDPALDVGQSFSDPDSGVTIATTWASSTSAAVNVTFGPVACVQANPTVALSPSQSQWVPAGTPVVYTVSVTNNDNAGCTASDFTLQATTVPAGWAAVFAAPTLTIGPGTTASTTLQVTSPIGTSDGFYTIVVRATNSAYTNSASVTYVIVSSLTVGVTTDKPSYTRNKTVSVTAGVTANGSPVANASVAFTITKPNGAGVVTGTATTGTNGTAVYKYRLKRSDQTGPYGVTANANLNGITGSGTASFTVQ